MNNPDQIPSEQAQFSRTGVMRGHVSIMLAGAMALLLMYPRSLRAQQFGMSAAMGGSNPMPMGQRDLRGPSYAVGDPQENPDGTDSDELERQL